MPFSSQGHILRGDSKRSLNLTSLVGGCHWGPWFSQLQPDPFPVEAVRSHLHKPCCFKWPWPPPHSLTLVYSLTLLDSHAGAAPSTALVQLWVKRYCSECTECCWQCCQLFWGLRKNPMDINKSIKAGMFPHILFPVCVLFFNLKSFGKVTIFNSIFIWWSDSSPVPH